MSAASQARRMRGPADLEIVAFEKGEYTSYSACGIPFLIGGCCTMVPGALAGVADVRGSVGLAHLDGHLDLYDEKSSPLGEAADMPVAVALGVGLDGLAEVVVAVGDRETAVGFMLHDEQLALDAEVEPEAQLRRALHLLSVAR